MPAPQLSFTKVVFPPTNSAAVHTYTAGSFFAVLSLQTQAAHQGLDIHSLGKGFFEQLETDFFSLEKKNIISIKQVIQTTLPQLPVDVTISFAATYIKDSVIYVFVAGAGSIFLKRNDTLATILDVPVSESSARAIKSASGYIQPNDVFFLATADFAHHISTDTLQTLSDRLPNEIADTLTGRLQTIENSSTASIIIKVEGLPQPADHILSQQQHVLQHSTETVYPTINQPAIYSEISREKKSFLSKFTFPKIRHLLPASFLSRFQVSTRSKIGFILAIVIIIIFVTSIFFIHSQQVKSRNQQIFHQYYDEALKHYDSGNGIASVNPAAISSQAEYQQAASLLQSAQKQLPVDSPEARQVNDLLSEVQAKMTAKVQTVSISPAVDTDSPLLALEKKLSPSYVVQGDDTLYYITATGIYKENTASPLVTNNNDWSKLGGFGTYFGNFYILDKTNGIIKYVTGNNGYGKTAYFAHDTHPQLTNAVSLAIDSSIYVLLSDGTVTKYTKGEPDTFSLKSWAKPLSSPTRIFTNADEQSIYILDNGNSRIVKVGKDGTFQSQYTNENLQQAKDIDVHESDKKIFFLTKAGLFSINM